MSIEIHTGPDGAIHELVKPSEIWLQPWCTDCGSGDSDGRMWCEDDVFDPCDQCGAKSVKYVLPLFLEDIRDALELVKAERDRLLDEVDRLKRELSFR